LIVKVRDWMTTEPFTLTEEDLVKSAVQHLLRAGIRHVPIVREGRLVGIVTDRDLRRVLPSVVAGASPEEYQGYMERTPLKEIMTADPITCTEDTDLVDVVRIFAERKFGAIPVVAGDRLVAILTQIDVLRAFLDILEHEGAGA
jgi:acetoin utilization protein AcuB